MAQEGRIYTLAEVLAGGFEARCDALNGGGYIWHGSEGIHVVPGGISRWICDPSELPEGDWYPTELGEKEIAGRPEIPEASSSRQAPSPNVRGRA